ncbi:MAG: DNA replication and repair protein RecF [Candidatus Rokubacteria bacterium]|nr:DNA replication and repair protein RecF [Candidatus Rokubacteria bacterium]
MHVRWLELSAFRNYASLSFAPDPGLNALIGPNGQGKTSLLEALHLLLTGRSFRTTRVAECVAWDAPEAVVTGEVAEAEQRRQIRVTVLPRGGVEATGGPCPWARAVSFAALDLELLTGAPAVRRAYLDGAAARLAPAHAEACRRYRLVLYQRGRLLGHLAGRADADRLLAPWDEQVAGLGGEIVHRRIETLEVLSHDTREVWRALAHDAAEMALVYAPIVPPGESAAATGERLLAALAAGRPAELQRGLTLAGPHRDDLVIRLGRADARAYASRGEQRLLAVTLRLAEAAAVRRRLGAPPVLLLDDILSELDPAGRGRVLAWLAGQGQVLFTTADALAAAGAAGAAWDVRRGEVEAVDAPRDVMVAGGAA